MTFSSLGFRHSLRKLLRQPLPNCIVIVVLAVGIGANTLMFMILDRLVLRPVPFADLGRLVAVWETDPLQKVAKGSVSARDLMDWQARASSFDAMTAIKRTPLSIRTQNGAVQVQGARVTGNFFSLLSSRVILGRPFRPQESRDFDGMVVISHGLWRRLFGADPGVVGHTAEVDGRVLTIVGVLRPGEEFPSSVDAWLPMRLEQASASRGNRSLLVIAKLKAGVPRAKAQMEMDGIARQLQKELPDTNAHSGVTLSPLREELVGSYRSGAWLVFASLGLILLIVCVNVTNMLVVRVAARRKEFAISIALGADRGEVIRQLILEVFLLTSAGAALGLALTLAGRSLLQASTLGRLVRAETLTLDLRILAFTLAIVLVVGSFMVLIPAAQFLGIRLNVLNAEEGELGKGKGNRALGLQRYLVTLQLAISLPLLVAAILMFQNLRQINQLDLGFNPDHVFIWRLTFPQGSSDSARRSQVVSAGLLRVRSLPGVAGVGCVSDLPFSGSRTSGGFVIVGREAASPEAPSSDLRVVAGDYFRALGIPLKRGRSFSDNDGRFAPGVAIINESLARRYWPNEDPIGRRLRIGAPEERALFGGSIEREIVGIVGDVVHEGLGAEPHPEIYLPYGQNPSAAITLAVRTHQELSAALPADVANSFKEERADLVISNVLPMRDMVSRSLGFPEVQTGVLTFLSLLSLSLVGMSIFAVISYLLAETRHNLVVRIALGAQSRDILWLIARQGLTLCLAGTAVGTFVSLVLARVLIHQVHLLEPRALPAAFLGAALVTVLTLVTSLAPTRRILGREPGPLLRYE